jgi:phosphoribosylformylglycinamidine (FGAM) synthase PurS component
VRAGKSFRLDVDAASADEALATAQALAERLLSNPVIEDATARLASA